VRASVVILTKLPGHLPIKTRLHGLLGRAGAEEFYLECLARTVVTAQRFCERPLLATSPADVDPHAVLTGLPDCRMIPIPGENGAVCLENALALEPCPPESGTIVALGGDAPDLPAARIGDALAALDDHDVAFVPTPDGGFSCLAVRAAVPDLASGFAYGGDDALDSLQRWMEARGLRVARVAGWPDVDTPEDYEALMARDRDNEDGPRTMAP